MICKYRMSIQQNRPPRAGWCVAAQTTAVDARSRICLRRPNKRSPPSGAVDPCHEIGMQTLVASLGLFERRFLACPAGGPQLYQQRLRQSLQERTLWRAWVAVAIVEVVVWRGRSWSDRGPTAPPGGGTRFFFQVMILHSRLGCVVTHYVGFRPSRGAVSVSDISCLGNKTQHTTSHSQPASHPATTTDASPLSRVRADDRTEVRAQYSSSYH